MPDVESPGPRCPTCGYLLHGLTTPRCPECGRDFGSIKLVDELGSWERSSRSTRIKHAVLAIPGVVMILFGIGWGLSIRVGPIRGQPRLSYELNAMFSLCTLGLIRYRKWSGEPLYPMLWGLGLVWLLIIVLAS